MTDAQQAAGDPSKHELLTLDEAAQRRFCSRSTIERRVYTGRIPAAQFGGKGGRKRTLVWSDDIDRDILQENHRSQRESRQRRARQGSPDA